MSIEKTHVYFVPGLAAGKEIFKNICLPEDRFEIHILEWLLPNKEESVKQYAYRMAKKVTRSNAALVGVSFGGVVAQEMNSYLDLKRLVIISSVKTRNELPKGLKLAGNFGAYKIIPTRWASSIKDLARFAIGARSKKRLTLYRQYLSVHDKVYLDWAIKQMVCWERTETIKGVIHIHGTADVVFPVKNIKDAVLLEGGTHVMILNKGSRVSKLLENIIENG